MLHLPDRVEHGRLLDIVDVGDDEHLPEVLVGVLTQQRQHSFAPVCVQRPEHLIQDQKSGRVGCLLADDPGQRQPRRQGDRVALAA